MKKAKGKNGCMEERHVKCGQTEILQRYKGVLEAVMMLPSISGYRSL